MISRKKTTPKRAIWRRAGFWSVIIILLAGGAATWYFFFGGQGVIFPQAAAASGPSYNTTTVRRGNIQISASGSGTLEANKTIDMSFSTRGTVTELDVKLGDMVKAGQVIARQGNSVTLQAAVTSAQLQLLQAQQALTTLQQNSSVALAQAYQDLLKAQTTYNTALTTQQRSVLPRCSLAVRQKYTTTLDDTQTKLNSMTKETFGTDAYAAAESAYQTALANFNYCAAYTTDEQSSAQASLDIAKAALQQAQTNYDTLKGASGVDPTQLALDEAKVNSLTDQLAKAQQDLAGIVLSAPMDGKVIFLAANPGAIVDTSTFVTIADVSHPMLQVSLDETDMSKLTAGATTQVVFDALPDQTFTGKIVQVTPQLVTTNNVQVAQGLVALDTSQAAVVQNLPLGLNATATVIDKQVNNALLVPTQALKDLGNQEYAVFVVTSTGQLHFTPVKVGINDGVRAEILSGLQEGQTVSTGTAQTLNTTSNSKNSSSSKTNNSNSAPNKNSGPIFIGGPGGGG